MKKIEVKDLVNVIGRELGSGYQVSHKETIKLNGASYDGVLITALGMNGVAPILPINEILDRIDSGELSLDSAARSLVEEYRKNPVSSAIPKDIKNFLIKDFILENVTYQIVNRKQNAKFLEEVLHYDIFDLAVTYICIVTNSDFGQSVIRITDKLLVHFSITPDELEEAACRNTKATGFVCSPMCEIIRNAFGTASVSQDDFDLEGDGLLMYVLTNTACMNGASVLLFPGQFKEVADAVGGDLFILPSSIHEVIVVPASFGELEKLSQMVRDINRTQLDQQEVLSDSIYLYHAALNEIRIVYAAQ